MTKSEMALALNKRWKVLDNLIENGLVKIRKGKLIVTEKFSRSIAEELKKKKHRRRRSKSWTW